MPWPSGKRGCHDLPSFASTSGTYYPDKYVGPMNTAVYPVTGGMEDWAYAASWDKTGYVKACKPTTYADSPAYDPALTTYGDLTGPLSPLSPPC